MKRKKSSSVRRLGACKKDSESPPDARTPPPPPRARGAGLHARAAAQIDKRLEDEGYASEAPEAFAQDMRLVFRNCIAYNPPEVRPASEMTRCMWVAEAIRPWVHALPRRAER